MAVLTVMDPIFGLLCIIMYQRNFLAALSSNNNANPLDYSVGGWAMVAMVIDLAIFSIMFLYLEFNKVGVLLVSPYCHHTITILSPYNNVGVLW